MTGGDDDPTGGPAEARRGVLQDAPVDAPTRDVPEDRSIGDGQEAEVASGEVTGKHVPRDRLVGVGVERAGAEKDVPKDRSFGAPSAGPAPSAATRDVPEDRSSRTPSIEPPPAGADLYSPWDRRAPSSSGPVIDLAVDATLLAPGVDPSVDLGADLTLPAAAGAPRSIDSEALTFRRSEGPRGRQAPPKIGRYLVIEPLGEGGMGVVYAAYDPQLDRKVAIKLVRPAYSETGGDEAQARLVREAQALARLRHPNVVQVYEVDAYGSEVYVAMEFVEGVTLRKWQFEHARSWREILRVYVAAGRGLAAAHHAGIVHRDFKPDNVLVTPAGEPRVLDFGLAFREEDPNPPAIDSNAEVLSTQLTMTGALLGTPAYMSPEQHRGSSADARSDIFAFCASLYEALYGVRPFAGGSVVEICDALFGGRLTPPPPFVKVPAWLRRVVLRGLRVDPGQRPPEMDVLLRALSHDPVVYLALGAGLLVVGGVIAAFVLLLRSAEGAQTLHEAGARVRADFDHERALATEEALARARGRSSLAHFNAWVVAAARERLEADPEGALAILKALDPRGDAWLPEARMIAAEAVSRGIPAASILTAPDRARALAFAPGDLLVTGHEGGLLALRRGDEVIASVKGPAAIVAIACAAVGEADASGREGARGSAPALRIAAVAADGSLGLWEPDGAIRWEDAHPGGALAVALDPGGAKVASGGADGRLRIARWEGEVLHRFPTHNAAVQAVAFGADGDALASGGADGSVILWKLGAKTHRLLEPLRAAVREVVWERERGRLHALGDRGEVRSWSVDAEVTAIHPPEDLAHLRAGGGRLLSVDLEGRRFVDADRPGARELRGDDEAIVALDLDDTGERAAFALASGRIERWDPRPITAEHLGRISGRIRALAWSHGGARLAAAARTGEVHLWEMPAGARRSLRSRGVGVVRLAFSPDDRFLVSEDEDQGLRAWDLAQDDPSPQVLRPPSRGAFSPLRFAADGALIYSGNTFTQSTITRVDPASAAATPIVVGDDGLGRFALAPSGAWALTAGSWTAPTIWRREGSEGPLRAAPLEIPEASMTWVAAIIDDDEARGRLAGTRDGRLEVWEVDRADGLAHLIYDDLEAPGVAVDERGEALLITDRAGVRRLWRLRAAEIHRLPACVAEVERFEVSSDGARALLIGGARDAAQSESACVVDLVSGASRRVGPGGDLWAWDGGGQIVSVVDGHDVLHWGDEAPADAESFLRWLDAKTPRTIDLERLRRPRGGPAR
ncbi:MAG: serine/threonine-protein kinase [Nannocystaceae bacterium]